MPFCAASLGTETGIPYQLLNPCEYVYVNMHIRM